jgi:hypothetical protein
MNLLYDFERNIDDSSTKNVFGGRIKQREIKINHFR